MQSTVVVLVVGALSGMLFQLISMLYFLNGSWTVVSTRKKFATVMGGGLSAMLVGLWILADQDKVVPYRLWFYQCLAGLAGFAFLAEARNGFMGVVRKIISSNGGGGQGEGG